MRMAESCLLTALRRQCATTADSRLLTALVLDGGLASWMEARYGASMQTSLWSAEVVLQDPDVVLRAHLDYLDAGADVITTASYQACEEAFYREGLSLVGCERCWRGCVELACRARHRYLATSAGTGSLPPRPAGWPLVAASCGCWGAPKHDGSEYTGYCAAADGAAPTMNDFVSFHRPRAIALSQERGADLLLFETIPCIAEGLAIVSMMATDPALVDVQYAISFAARDGKYLAHAPDTLSQFLCDAVALGSRLQIESETMFQAQAAASSDVVATVRKPLNGPVGIGINCCHPVHIQPLFASLLEDEARCNWEILEGQTGRRILKMAYPNSGKDQWDPERGSFVPAPPDTASEEWPTWEGLRQWVQELGIAIVGGCCRTTPDTIRRIRSLCVGRA